MSTQVEEAVCYCGHKESLHEKRRGAKRDCRFVYLSDPKDKKSRLRCRCQRFKKSVR